MLGKLTFGSFFRIYSIYSFINFFSYSFYYAPSFHLISSKKKFFFEVPSVARFFEQTHCLRFSVEKLNLANKRNNKCAQVEGELVTFTSDRSLFFLEKWTYCIGPLFLSRM